MRPLLPRLVIVAGASAVTAPACAAELDGATSCADYLRMETADTAPGADPVVTRAHVTSLMREYLPYVLRGPDGRPLDTIVPFIISYSTHWCQAHPTATVADAGHAVGAAEQKALHDAGHAPPAPARNG